MQPQAETAQEDIRVRMDRMYRPQKYIYDLTRKYYLLGRDRLVAELDAQPGQQVLDLGCGTGRNLAMTGAQYPGVALYGLDAAAPMLEIARARLAKAGVSARLKRGVAEALDPSSFGVNGGFDHITISYCLSMVDQPAAAVRAAVAALAPGGTLHVVDFGNMQGLPSWFTAAMRAWLARFHVHHRPEVEATMRELAAAHGMSFERHEIMRGYALLLRLHRD